LAKHWFVFYTKSRHEKKVRDLLERNGFEVFLPMHKVLRQWSDRKKKVEVPLFNSYIFVLEEEHRIPEVLKTPGVSINIRVAGKPAVLRQEELDLVQRFIASGYFMETDALQRDEFKSGDQAKVIDGPLRGVVGTIFGETDDGKLSVLIEGINQVIRVKVKVELLEKVGSR
jgi:transcription antitermination factor NusG